MRRLPALSACWQGKALLEPQGLSVVERKCPMNGVTASFAVGATPNAEWLTASTDEGSGDAVTGI